MVRLTSEAQQSLAQQNDHVKIVAPAPAQSKVQDIWPEGFNFFFLHGLMMWTAWTIFGLVQIISNRYMKGTLVGINMWIHRISGALVFAVTSFFGFEAFHKVGWAIFNNTHSYFVFPVLFGVFIIVILGVASRSAKRRLKWNTKTALILTNIHKGFSYLLILSGYGGLFTGIQGYRTNPKHAFDFPLEWLNLGCTIFVFGIMEIIYQKLQMKDNQYSPKVEALNQSMTYDEFCAQVKEGVQLVILDHYVLDIGKFLDEHPGGRFSLEHNIGRDVSKFFHGGYSLENISKVSNHTHSNDARRAVNKFIIAKLENNSQTRTMTVSKAQRNANIQGSVKVMQFEQSEVGVGKVDSAYIDPTCSILDYKQIGKHYLVKSTSNQGPLWGPTKVGDFDDSKVGIKRHYTEAFCMRQGVYDALINLVNQNQMITEECVQVMNDNNTLNLCLTIKNYSTNKGLSNHIHDTVGRGKVGIQGPLGSGLAIKARGRHVAFAAGTGILVFIDLVAHLILRLTGFKFPQHLSNNQIDIDNFQFILHTSFANEQDAIALDLINCLVKLCERLGKQHLFQHISRMSQLSRATNEPIDSIVVNKTHESTDTTKLLVAQKNNKMRWNNEFFTGKLIQYSKKNQGTASTLVTEKIWICGPPGMQESFDRAADSNKGLFGEKNDVIHIL